MTSNKDQKHPLLFVAVLTLICLLSAAFLLYSTVWGLGWMSDSFQYVSSAVNFANGRGLSYFIGSNKLSPLNHYPPFYSIVLSAYEFIEMDTVEGARWLNAALLGLNVFLVGVSIKMITSSIALSWLGALIVGLSPAVLGVHSWLLSEPLYLVLGTASILALGGYFAYNNSNPDEVWRAIGLLVLPATLAGLALITRFVGLSLIAMGFIGLLIIPHESLRRKLLRAFIWSVASIIPMALWSARNYLVTGAYTDRMIGWNALTAKNIGILVNTVLTWWLPDSIVGGRERYLAILGLIVLISLVSIFYMIWRKSGRELKSGSRQLPASLSPQTLLHSLYLLTYLGIIFVARTLLEPGMGMTDRMLIPLYISGVIVLFDLLHKMLSMENRFARIVAIILCSYLLLFNSVAAIQTVISSHETGFGVSKKKWHESDVIQTLREVEDVPIYSNVPSTVYLWTRADSYGLRSFSTKLEDRSLEESVLILFEYDPVSAHIQRITEDLVYLGGDDIASMYLYKP